MPSTSRISILTEPSSSSSSSSKNLIANVLPCQIEHDGPANSVARHWLPLPHAATSSTATTDDADGSSNTTEAYFRGRKLVGTRVKVPGGYAGHVVQATGTTTTVDDEEENGGEGGGGGEEEGGDGGGGGGNVEVEEWRSIGRFEEVVVYGHEGAPEDGKDRFVRGVGEWVEFSKAINGYDDETGFDGSG